IQRQLGSDPPAVANVESEHVLQAVHFDELAALSRIRRGAQQKTRHAVPAIFKGRGSALKSTGGGDRSSVQRSYGIPESERAAWTGTQFRLPVVHQVMEKIEAKPNLVRTL